MADLEDLGRSLLAERFMLVPGHPAADRIEARATGGRTRKRTGSARAATPSSNAGREVLRWRSPARVEAEDESLDGRRSSP
jgi:hypothetical protein